MGGRIVVHATDTFCGGLMELASADAQLHVDT